MRKITPDWEAVSTFLMIQLDNTADEINWKLENGEDPAITVNDAVEDLKQVLEAIETDPGQFSMQDVS